MLSYFPWLCVCPRKAEFCVFNYCAVLWCSQIIEYIMAWCSHTVIYTLHDLIAIIIQIYLKVLNCQSACQIYSVSIVRSVISTIFHAIYGTVCIQLTHLSYDDCENTCTWSYFQHQVGSLTYLQLLRVRSWNNVVRCMSFYIPMYSCFIVLVVFLVIVQSSELISVWFCEKMTFFPNVFSYHIFAKYVGGASLGLPTAWRLIAVSGARLPSVDGLVVRCIKMHHHVKSAITICLQFI